MNKVSNIFRYLFVAVLSIVLYIGVQKLFQTTEVYLDCDTNIYHSTPVCDSIRGFDRMFYEDTGEALGSMKIDEKDVFCDTKYKMCKHCFSLMEQKGRESYILGE